VIQATVNVKSIAYWTIRRHSLGLETFVGDVSDLMRGRTSCLYQKSGLRAEGEVRDRRAMAGILARHRSLSRPDGAHALRLHSGTSIPAGARVNLMMFG